MPGKQAKILSEKHIEDLLFFADSTRYPERNRVIILLSLKAGLRAAEIANLTWDMVQTPGGEIGTVIELCDDVAKMGHGRRIPTQADLRAALVGWRALSPDARAGPWRPGFPVRGDHGFRWMTTTCSG